LPRSTLRAEAADLEPRVQFHERPSSPRGQWTLLGGPEGAGAPLDIACQEVRVEVLDGVPVFTGEAASSNYPIFKGPSTL
jgi:hypothetical protein